MTDTRVRPFGTRDFKHKISGAVVHAVQATPLNRAEVTRWSGMTPIPEFMVFTTEHETVVDQTSMPIFLSQYELIPEQEPELEIQLYLWKEEDSGSPTLDEVVLITGDNRAKVLDWADTSWLDLEDLIPSYFCCKEIDDGDVSIIKPSDFAAYWRLVPEDKKDLTAKDLEPILFPEPLRPVVFRSWSEPHVRYLAVLVTEGNLSSVREWLGDGVNVAWERNRGSDPFGQYVVIVEGRPETFLFYRGHNFVLDFFEDLPGWEMRFYDKVLETQQKVAQLKRDLRNANQQVESLEKAYSGIVWARTS